MILKRIKTSDITQKISVNSILILTLILNVLWSIKSEGSRGKEGDPEITRGFPVHPKSGERADHPHQIGMWLTYGNVNGNDFWGNGSKGLGTKNANGGVIKHHYPTFWHARGYGLLAANPLGVTDFTNGKEILGFSIGSGQSVTFRYRIIICSGDDFSREDIERFYNEFNLINS